MLKKCTILGLVVLSLGGIALACGHYRTQAQRAQVSRQTPPKGALRSQEYISKYGRWYELAPDEQTRLVIELDNERRTKPPLQLAQEQQDRLRADTDKLAAGEMVPSEIVTYLYGPDWQQEVTRYREQAEQTRSIQAAAVICVSFGAGLFGLCSIVTLCRLMVRAPRNTQDCESNDSNLESETADCGLPIVDCGLEGEAEIRNPKSEIADPPGEPAETKPRRRAQRPLVAVDFELPAEPFLSIPPSAVCTLESETAPSAAVETLQDQAEDLQRQIAEFKVVAESVQQATIEKSEPLSDTLKELTEQVSAIRDYAAGQQDRMTKLQDGYDWGIIRTFCLRVIRCIDNIEGRIEELTAAGESAEHLEEVRDELLFALESSGVEPFEPKFGSEYGGQEKYAEAVKQKQTSGRSDKAGTIAKVIRPGYRYVMDEENYKVVRTAQVMLFG